MQNPYQTLGVDRSATPDQIKQAYRKLASRHHPDRGGDTKVFQEIQTAYDTLSDPQRRAAYDNPGFGGMPGGFGGQPFNFETIFDIFGTRFQGGFVNPNQRAQARMTLWITLADSAQGGRRTISVGTHAGTQAVEIDIPLGINDGDTVQYSGLAPGGADLVVQYRIHADPRFQRQGHNLIMEHVIDIWDCILGCETEVRDVVNNRLALTIPPRTAPGTVLRLRGRGMANRQGATGDLLVQIRAKMPDHIDQDLLDLIESKRHNSSQ